MALAHGRLERGNDGLVKDILEALLCEGRALQVFDGAELARQALALVGCNGLLAILGELLDRGRVVSQIDLGADNQARHAGAMMPDLVCVCVWAG